MVDGQRLRDPAIRVGLDVGPGPPVGNERNRVGPVHNFDVRDHDQPVAEGRVLGEQLEQLALLWDHDLAPPLLPPDLFLQAKGDRSMTRRECRHLEPKALHDQTLQLQGPRLNGGVSERRAKECLQSRDRHHGLSTGWLWGWGKDHLVARRDLANPGASDQEHEETGGDDEQANPPVHARSVHRNSEKQTSDGWLPAGGHDLHRAAPVPLELIRARGEQGSSCSRAMSVPAAIIGSSCGRMTFSRRSARLRSSASSVFPRNPACACGPSWRGRTRPVRSRTGSPWPWWKPPKPKESCSQGR